MSNLNKTQKIILIVIAITIAAIVGYYIYGRNFENNNITNDEEILVNETKDIQEGQIIVHITGAVKNEGIVNLNENSRISDAINAAGGLTDDADMSKINLAQILEDGIKIKIPSINDKSEEAEEGAENEQIVEILPESTTSINSGASSKIININKASQTELETLPGIGPSTALKIIDYRNENGKFSNIEDLKKVSGIGDSKFENIKNLISVK